MAVEAVATLACHRGPVLSCAGGGAHAVTGGEDGRVLLSNCRAALAAGGLREPHAEFMAPQRAPVLALALARGQELLAAAGRGLCVWDVASGALVARHDGQAGPRNRMLACEWSRHAQLLMAGGEDRTVTLFDARQRPPRPAQRLTGFGDAVTSLAAPEDEPALILAGCADGVLRAFDARRGRLVEDRLGHSVAALAPVGTGRSVLVACLGPGRVCELEVASGRLKRTLRGHASSDTRTPLAWASGVPASLRSSSPASSSGRESSASPPACWRGGSSLAVAGSEDGALWAWDLEAGVGRALPAHKHPVSALVCAEGWWVSAAYDGGTVVHG